MDELKPCPFCGGKCDPSGWFGGYPGGEERRGPECDDCGATAESVAAWNRRAQPVAQAEQANPWKDAVIDALVISWSLKADHDSDPRKALADLIDAETRMALDPEISERARALIESGRAAQPPAEPATDAEPVAWQERQEIAAGHFGDWYIRNTCWSVSRPSEIESGGIRYQFRPLFAHPPRPEPLTDADLNKIISAQWGEHLSVNFPAHRAFARALEAAIRAKGTP